MASRVESSGIAGQVHISQDTYIRVKDIFKCIHLGQVEAKNIGMIDVYKVEDYSPSS